ncbi:hypothetical protein [Campylobacter ureolyticus]|uniref:Membrane protein n=1 Tax=Campylobacter ureolyticus TaxID=827 RepID=A0AAE7E9R3_9BACT|nr:hypothetical protein [Campylobacter ureolyticus]MCR8685440.1 hypothetical protein [Campylobacter ureolyticus]QKF84224.1 putative membrane protein [Campylobacter ureolyticus]SUX23649.1 Uncharacterised protein [Campylobacter ureolyticus]
MSDDKREKLREYLRNNRPKNSVNLGNSSDNKEKSNKNLENNLNLDNSILDNSQISNNKINSNKRDYDKEPIILKDYTAYMKFHYFLYISFWVAASFLLFLYTASIYEKYDIGLNIFHFLIVFMIFILFDISIFHNLTSTNSVTKIYNNRVEIFENGFLKTKFYINSKDKIEFYTFKSFFRNYFIMFLLIFLLIFFDNKFEALIVLLFVILSIIIGLFYNILITSYIYKKSNKTLKHFFKHYGKFHIDVGWDRYSKFSYYIVEHKGISMFYFNENDYLELKKYFQTVHNKNLDKDIKLFKF